MFTTAQQVYYSNWNPGEPNDSGGEDCVHLLESTHTQNDLNCARNHSYICQKGYINIFFFIYDILLLSKPSMLSLKIVAYLAYIYIVYMKIKSSCVFLQNFMYYERPVQPNDLSTQRSFVKRVRVWLNKTSYKNLVQL